MKPKGLSLYHFDGCPYCGRVRDAMARLDLEIELRDIQTRPDYRQELVAATGKQMVPCLRIEQSGGAARWMHESADIVRYLEREVAGKGLTAGPRALAERARAFAHLAGLPDERIDLAEAALWIAAEDYPGLTYSTIVSRLAQLAERARASARARRPALRRASRHCTTSCTASEGFRGNRADYYDARNSFLNEVLERRTGIPITLAIVYTVGRGAHRPARARRRLPRPLPGARSRSRTRS